MEVIGMAIGSMFLGGVADKIGRRRTVLACTTVMALGMFMVPTSRALVELSIWRVFAGLGIGGMLATINAIAAEFSNTKRRDLSVSVMSLGYPIGTVVGGILAQRLLAVYTWRSVFYLGAIATTVLIPVVFIFVPESVQWLTQRRPAGALDRINETLRRMGHGAVADLSSLSTNARKLSIADVFKPGLVHITVLVTLAYLFHITRSISS
jgi:MFS family permease